MHPSKVCRWAQPFLGTPATGGSSETPQFAVLRGAKQRQRPNRQNMSKIARLGDLDMFNISRTFFDIWLWFSLPGPPNDLPITFLVFSAEVSGGMAILHGPNPLRPSARCRILTRKDKRAQRLNPCVRRPSRGGVFCTEGWGSKSFPFLT